MEPEGVAFHWMLFGHVAGVAILAAGVGAYMFGLHRLVSARDAGRLRDAEPVVRGGENLTLGGFVLVLGTGVGLGLDAGAFDDAWLITSLILLAVVAVAGRVSGVRLNRLFAALHADPASATPGAPPAAGGSVDVLAAAADTRIHLPADVTVIAIVEIIYLMTLHPGGWGIAVATALALLAAVGAAWWVRRSTAGRTGAAAAVPGSAPQPVPGAD